MSTQRILIPAGVWSHFTAPAAVQERDLWKQLQILQSFGDMHLKNDKFYKGFTIQFLDGISGRGKGYSCQSWVCLIKSLSCLHQICFFFCILTIGRLNSLCIQFGSGDGTGRTCLLSIGSQSGRKQTPVIIRRFGRCRLFLSRNQKTFRVCCGWVPSCHH